MNDAEKAAEDLQTKADTLKAKIDEAADQWLAPVKELVERISSELQRAFAELGYYGMCVLKVPEDERDFADYGIELKVQFRKEKQLDVLNARTQSGGERSVSTILYLMALQELTQCPFRIVDEINQGMDPNNERRVFRQIVERASVAGTSQYFLITPKLLPDLSYNEHTNVLCVYNGPGMVDHTEWNLNDFLAAEA